MKRLALSTLALALLLPASDASASGLHFEAWPTATNDGCPAPCYQVQMFLEVPEWWEQDLGAIQFDIDVQNGAVPATLPVPPNENENAGPGTVAILDQGRARMIPWDLANIVGRSPNTGFDALMVNSASAPVTVEALRDLLADPDTRCFHYLDGCDLVADALALNRIYLGFFNVTREADAPIGPYWDYTHAVNNSFLPTATPYFSVVVSQPIGNGGVLRHLLAGSGPVPFLPEPPLAVVLTGALAMLLTMRLRT